MSQYQQNLKCTYAETLKQKVAVDVIDPEVMHWKWCCLPTGPCDRTGEAQGMRGQKFSTTNRTHLFSLGFSSSRLAGNLIKSKSCKSTWWVTIIFVPCYFVWYNMASKIGLHFQYYAVFHVFESGSFVTSSFQALHGIYQVKRTRDAW
jgi:hypothetical protein